MTFRSELKKLIDKHKTLTDTEVIAQDLREALELVEDDVVAEGAPDFDGDSDE